MRRIAMAVLIVLGPALHATRGATAQEAQTAESKVFSLVLLPYAGVSDNPREMRLPVSPMAGMRITGEVWLSVTNSVRLAPFLGVAGTILAVNGDASLEIDYLTTVEAGIKADLPAQPYLIGYFGRAYPVANQTYDAELRKWVGGESVIFGLGAGLSPVVGRSAFNIEGRYRRDRRFAAHLDESFEILVGFPTWIGSPW